MKAVFLHRGVKGDRKMLVYFNAGFGDDETGSKYVQRLEVCAYVRGCQGLGTCTYLGMCKATDRS